jgi:AraC-like DNA-binding protein
MRGGRKNAARPPLELPFAYCDNSELRVLDLSPDGIPCVPVLGRTSLNKPGLLVVPKEHVHPECIEVSFCQRGLLAVKSKGELYQFKPGSVFVSRPNEPHTLCQFPRGMLMYWMLFRLPQDGGPVLSLPDGESRWLVESLEKMPNRLFCGGDRVRGAFQRVFAAYDKLPRETPQRPLLMRLAVMDLLVTVIEMSTDVDFDYADKRIERVIADIRANPVETFSIDDLVSKLSMSPSSIMTNFKRQTGLPPLAFRNACRIEMAKTELSDGDRAISAIAAKLGYSSSQNFATQFRLATKKTPRQWRAAHR